MDQRYYCQQRYGGDGGYMDGPPQYGQHMPRNAYKQPYNNYSRPNHNYNNYGKHNPVPVDTNNYYKQPHPSAPTHWQPMPQPQAPPPPAPPTFAPPPPPPAPVHSKSGKKDVVALIVENNNLKRMIVLHMSLLQEQTDKLEKKNKQLDERNLRIETLLAQKQELLQQVARLGHTVDELRCHRRRSNKRTAIEDVAPKPKVPCFVENQTQTEAMQQQVLVEQVQQVVEPSVVHHCYQPQPQPAPQRKPTQNVIVTSVTELPPTTPALEHIKGHGGFNGGKKFSTIILHRVHQESSSLQLQEEQGKHEHEEHEQDDDADQLQIDEEIQTNMHEQHEVFLEEEQLQNDEQHIYHDGMEGMTETVIGAEEELGAVEEMAEENINNGHMIEISDMGQVVGHIDIERLRRLGINCVKQSDREHQHPQQLHLYETPQSQLLQSSAEDDVVNALLQSQQSEIILQAEPIETANISEIPQKQKPSKYLAPIANACPEPVKKVRTFAKTRVNQVVRKLPTLENSKRLENVNANYKPHMLAKPVVVQDEEQKRQEAAAEEQKRQLEIQLKQEQEALEQKKREFELQQQQQQEQERKQQMLMEEQLRKQREEQELEEQRAKQKELERQQQLMQAQLRKQEEERQEQLKKQQQEQERQEQLKKQQELARQEQLKKQEQARQEELRKKEQQQKRQEEAKQKKQEEHLKMLDLERSEKKKRIQEKRRKQLLEQKKQERDQKKKIEVQKIKERNKARQELLRIQNQKQESKLISEVQTEALVKPTQQQPDSKVENQKPVEPQSEPIAEEEEDVEETIVRRLQEHLQKEQQRMQEHIQKEQQRLQSLQQQQPMVRLKRSPMDSNMGSNTSLIYPPLPQSSSTTSTTTTMTSSSTMTLAPTPPPTNAVSPRLRGVKLNPSTTTQTTTTTTVTAATEKTTPTPLTPQSSSKRKRQQANKANNRNTSKFLTSLQPYTTRSWEDQEFHCDNEFFIEEADELLADNPSLEIPKWKVVKLPRCNDDKNIERLNNTVYELRHDKYVRDEIERKKRDARYNLEQNKIEALRQRHNQDEVLVPLPPLPTSTFYPLPEDIEGIQFVTEVPVQAFGENMLNPHTQDGHFSLPWLAATLAATAEERAKAAAMPVATLANKKLPTTKKDSSHQELHSSYVFLKRRKRQQRR